MIIKLFYKQNFFLYLFCKYFQYLDGNPFKSSFKILKQLKKRRTKVERFSKRFLELEKRLEVFMSCLLDEVLISKTLITRKENC